MRTITVKGIGKVSAPVDTVELSFHVSQIDQDYEKALNGASAKVEALEQALVRAGFSAEDFQTAGFHVNTQYENVPNQNGIYQTVFAGYNCSYDQLLRFSFDTDRLGQALAAVAGSKAQPELNVNFTVKEPERLQEQLLENAAKSARTRAEVLCRAAGVRLGTLENIEYDFSHLNFRSETMMDLQAPMMAKRSMAVNLRPQDIDLQDSAVFVWALESGEAAG